MKTFDLTEHVLQRYQCDFFYYYINNSPANDDNNIVYVDFSGVKNGIR